jgi:hypothetical protein
MSVKQNWDKKERFSKVYEFMGRNARAWSWAGSLERKFIQNSLEQK